LKSKNLLGTAEFEPKERVRVKSVDGYIIRDPWKDRDQNKRRKCGNSVHIPVGKQTDRH
jgi:hypothetical protein